MSPHRSTPLRIEPPEPQAVADTLESDIAALAMIGERSDPVSGYSAPAAMGMPITSAQVIPVIGRSTRSPCPSRVERAWRWPWSGARWATVGPGSGAAAADSAGVQPDAVLLVIACSGPKGRADGFAPP